MQARCGYTIIERMSEDHLTHLDESGQAKMVDVGAKPDTERVAVAGGEVLLKAGNG